MKYEKLKLKKEKGKQKRKNGEWCTISKLNIENWKQKKNMVFYEFVRILHVLCTRRDQDMTRLSIIILRLRLWVKKETRTDFQWKKWLNVGLNFFENTYIQIRMRPRRDNFQNIDDSISV